MPWLTAVLHSQLLLSERLELHCGSVPYRERVCAHGGCCRYRESAGCRESYYARVCSPVRPDHRRVRPLLNCCYRSLVNSASCRPGSRVPEELVVNSRHSRGCKG